MVYPVYDVADIVHDTRNLSEFYLSFVITQFGKNKAGVLRYDFNVCERVLGISSRARSARRIYSIISGFCFIYLYVTLLDI